MTGGITKTVRYTILIGWASAWFSAHPSTRYCRMQEYRSPSSSSSTELGKLVTAVRGTAHHVTSLLSLLSLSLCNGHPLSSYIESKRTSPKAIERLNGTAVDDLLGARHLGQLDHGAFAFIQICSYGVHSESEVLRRQVKGLVGETDFSFRAAGQSA